jgi:hypothetical protein
MGYPRMGHSSIAHSSVGFPLIDYVTICTTALLVQKRRHYLPYAPSVYIVTEYHPTSYPSKCTSSLSFFSIGMIIIDDPTVVHS